MNDHKKRKQKTRGEILQDATERVEDYGGYFKGQRIYYTLVNLWKTAYTRGYDKALRDQAKEVDNGNS